MSQAFKCDVCQMYCEGDVRATLMGWGGCNKLELCYPCHKFALEALKTREPKTAEEES